MTRSRLMFATVALFSLCAIVAFPLRAQPNYPVSPTTKPPAKELIVPPGIYTSFIFACEGADGQSGRATFKAGSGEMTVVVRAGDSVVVPMANWSLGQQATITLSESTRVTITVSAITTSGPVKFEPAKK